MALYPLMPNKMSVDRDEHGKLYYSYQRSQEEAPTMKGNTVTLRPEDVLHIPGLGFDGLVGYSPIAMAKNANSAGFGRLFRCWGLFRQFPNLFGCYA